MNSLSINDFDPVKNEFSTLIFIMTAQPQKSMSLTSKPFDLSQTVNYAL
jgi:hypothetical protein